MKKIIHHLRRQPEEVRRHILHILTILCAIVLLSFWIYSLSANFTSPDIGTKIKNDLQPLSALKDNLVGGYNSISGNNQ
jgi:hypothetical protein